MHGKITLISDVDFFAHFLPSMKTPKSTLDLTFFADLETPPSENRMYESLVSQVFAVSVEKQRRSCGGYSL